MTTRTAAPPTATRFAGAVLALALTLSGALGGPLDRSVEILISNTNLGRATIAIHAVDLDTGREIVSHNAGTPMIPASNMKIVSSGGALLTLGESFAFRTEIRIARDGERTSLIIVGSGDPALGDPAFYEGMGPDALTHDDLFDAVASALRERGIGRVDEVVVDDRIFDREWAHDCWPRDQLNRWYCAEVGGLNFHTNVINMYPIPGTAGATPAVRTQPELPWITIHNRAKTITRGRNSVWVSRPNPENTFTLMGNVRGKTEIPVSVHEPSRVAGELFALALEDRGIEISAGQFRARRRAARRVRRDMARHDHGRRDHHPARRDPDPHEHRFVQSIRRVPAQTHGPRGHGRPGLVGERRERSSGFS